MPKNVASARSGFLDFNSIFIMIDHDCTGVVFDFRSNLLLLCNFHFNFYRPSPPIRSAEVAAVTRIFSSGANSYEIHGFESLLN